ncbi:hypothetical protein GCM10017557_81600 [Streptomyces aurantiacus]|uniref:Uncharacterized protein n=1 Tax=Streptomyces aurantiacus TaxID=47760 RepID=A0A7G1PFJ7_9ACTN|nr:hypothetical protein GCM10017557_81600 [Streptomyces aurantiacus]
MAHGGPLGWIRLARRPGQTVTLVWHIGGGGQSRRRGTTAGGVSGRRHVAQAAVPCSDLAEIYVKGADVNHVRDAPRTLGALGRLAGSPS